MCFAPKSFRLLLIAVAVSAIAGRARAGQVNYTIDPAQSYVQLTLWRGNQQISIAQAPGTDTTSLSGTIGATIAGGTISFSGDTTINYANQSMNLLPDAGGGTATNPDPNGTGGTTASFGLELNPALGLGTGFLNYTFASAISSGPIPLSNGTYGTADPTQMSMSVTQPAPANYWLNSTLGVKYGLWTWKPDDTGVWEAKGKTNAPPIIVSPNGSMVIPIDIVLPGRLFYGGGSPAIDYVFTGQIVATAVPEPSSLVLAVLGAAGLAVPVLRRRRHPINGKSGQPGDIPRSTSS
jgi:hypothetical protein